MILPLASAGATSASRVSSSGPFIQRVSWASLSRAEKARVAIFECVETFYNRTRLNTALDCLSDVQVENHRVAWKSVK